MSSSKDPWPPGDREAIERLVDTFETAWRAGQRPLIESFLDQATPEDRLALLRELLRLDLALRAEAGKQVRIEEYLRRFPELEQHPAVPLELMALQSQRDPDEVISRLPSTQPELPAVPASEAAELPAQPGSASGFPGFPGYRVRSEVGRGGLSVVYLAEEEQLGLTVVLKTVLSQQPMSAEERARFLQGARALARLHHPGCCPVFAIGEGEAGPFLVLPYFEGGSLRELIAREGPLEEGRAADLTRKLALAISHAHERAVIHRNLKPGAVLFDQQGEPVIISFGLARHLTTPDPRLTLEGALMGTPSYMAPEQAQGKEASPATDIYALGAILYECLTGRPPFKAASTHETLRRVIEQQPVPPRRLRPEVSTALEAICLKCLRMDPARRPASAKQLADELDTWRQHRRPGLLGSLGQSVVAAIRAVWSGFRWLGRSLRPRRLGLLFQAAGEMFLHLGSAREPPSGEMVRYLVDAFFPEQPRIGKLYNLGIQLRSPDEPLGETRRLMVPGANPWEVPAVAGAAANRRPGSLSVGVTVTVAAEHFRIEGSARLELDVPVPGRSPMVHFRLRGEQSGEGRIMIDLFQRGRPAGSLDLDRPIGPGDHEGNDDGAPGGPGEVLLAPAPVPGPDVVLKVFERRCSGQPGQLQFVLFSTHPGLQDLPVWDGDLGALDLRVEVASWVESQLKPLGELAGRTNCTDAEVDRALRAIGANCFDILPAALKDLSWVLRRRKVRTMLVLSDDPHLPWELVKPVRTDALTGAVEEEDDFWGRSFALTHWLRGRPAVQRLSLDRIYAVAAGGTASPVAGLPIRDLVLVEQAPVAAVSPTLPLAEEELAVLRSLPGPRSLFVVLPALRRELHEVFEKGGFDLFHLACHGSFGGGLAADNSVVLMEDGPFSAAELSPLVAAPLRQASPLIFFNACHSGRSGFSLTRLGSWGARLVQLGCGGFVGTLWPVTDRAAVCFARAFYQKLCSGLAVGESMRQAREQVHQDHPADPTWLAYRCFADPLARLGQIEGRRPPSDS